MANYLTLDHLAIILSITSILISFLGLLLGGVSLIKTIALEKQTHSVQFMPAEQFGDWATPEKEISEINEEFKEDIIEPFPGI